MTAIIFRGDYPAGDFYRVKIEHENRSYSIENIRKQDVRHIHEIVRQNPEQKDLDKIVQSFSKFYDVPLLIVIDHWQEDTLESQNGITQSKITLSKHNDKAIMLAKNLDHVDGLIKLTNKASYVNPQYEGTILDELKNDKNNEFYYSLINKIKAISSAPSNTDNYLKSVIAYFHFIAKNASYAQYFAELGYWSENRINQNEVISLYHYEPELKILFLYLKESDLAIAIALDTPNIELSLDDPRIKNLVEKILTL